MKRIAIYARVSTGDQTTENQIRELESVAEKSGWQIVARFIDNGISGAKGRDKRPEFDKLIRGATRKEFDMIASWSVDRLSRSMPDLVNFMSEIQSVGCDLYLHQQAIDTSTPSGRALFQMCGVFAEFERAMIQERVKSGMARAKANGKTFGRPKVAQAVEDKIKIMIQNDNTIRAIAKECGVGLSVVQRIKREAA